MKVQFNFIHKPSNRCVKSLTVDPKLQLYRLLIAMEEIVDRKLVPLHELTIEIQEHEQS